MYDVQKDNHNHNNHNHNHNNNNNNNSNNNNKEGHGAKTSLGKKQQDSQNTTSTSLCELSEEMASEIWYLLQM